MSQEKKKRKYNSQLQINIIPCLNEYNKIGDDDEETQTLVHAETLTRRRQATLEEKKRLQKIDKEKVVHKKKILIPEIKRNDEEYNQMVRQNKDKIQKINEQRNHYIRFFMFKDKYPNESEYFVDQEDIQFISQLTNKNIKEITLESQELQTFKKIIEILEEKND